VAELKSYTCVRRKLIWRNRTEKHRFTDLWCAGTSAWNKQEVSWNNVGFHSVQRPRTVWTKYAKHFRGALANLFAEQVHRLTFINCARYWNCVPTVFSRSNVQRSFKSRSFVLWPQRFKDRGNIAFWSVGILPQCPTGS